MQEEHSDSRSYCRAMLGDFSSLENREFSVAFCHFLYLMYFHLHLYYFRWNHIIFLLCDDSSVLLNLSISDIKIHTFVMLHCMFFFEVFS